MLAAWICYQNSKKKLKGLSTNRKRFSFDKKPKQPAVDLVYLWKTLGPFLNIISVF